MLRVLLSSALVTFVALPVSAKDVTVNDQEQTAISQICEIAARSSNIPVATNAQVAAWCVQWDSKVKTPPATVPPPEPKKD